MFALLVAACLMDVSVDDCDAMFRQNCTEWSTLRVSWRRTSSPTEAPWKYDQANLKSYQKQLERKDLTTTAREQMELRLKQIRYSETAVIADLRRTIQQDFWSNRSRFQWRYRWSASSGHEYMGPTFQELRHPDCESFPTDLIGPLSDRLVISGGFEDGSFRVWFGGEKLGQFWKGGTTLEPPAIEVEYYPPLVNPPASWKGHVHPIDSFFRPNPVAQRVIGDYSLNGVLTTVVFKAWNVSPPQKDGYDVERAYLDRERGAIPLRIEIGLIKSIANLETISVAPYGAGGKTFPLQIVHSVELKEVRPGIFYPVRGVHDVMGPEPKERVSNHVGAVVPYKTADWDVSKVEFDRPMPTEMFDLKFPPNTVFHDAKTNETRITGDVDGFSELAINRALQPVQSRTAWLWWGIPSGAGLVLILFVAFRRWTRKAR